MRRIREGVQWKEIELRGLMTRASMVQMSHVVIRPDAEVILTILWAPSEGGSGACGPVRAKAARVHGWHLARRRLNSGAGDAHMSGQNSV